MDRDEKIVRKRLVKVWTKILEKYARPGAEIPPVEVMRRELWEVGVDAAVDAICSEHWFIFPFMVQDQIEEKVRNELARFKLAEFIEDVKIAQWDPAMLEELRERIKVYVIEGL